MEAVCREAVIEQLDVVEIRTVLKGLELLVDESREKAKMFSDLAIYNKTAKQEKISNDLIEFQKQECEYIENLIYKIRSIEEDSSFPF